MWSMHHSTILFLQQQLRSSISNTERRRPRTCALNAANRADSFICDPFSTGASSSTGFCAPASSEVSRVNHASLGLRRASSIACNSSPMVVTRFSSGLLHASSFGGSSAVPVALGLPANSGALRYRCRTAWTTCQPLRGFVFPFATWLHASTRSSIRTDAADFTAACHCSAWTLNGLRPNSYPHLPYLHPMRSARQEFNHVLLPITIRRLSSERTMIFHMTAAGGCAAPS